MSMVQAMIAAFDVQLSADSSIIWPAVQFQGDPVGFYETILGLEPWSRQVEMLEAMRDHQFGTVSAGRKVSKSNSIAGAALWRYSCWEYATVVFMSTTTRQVDEILWSELRKLAANSGRCLKCRREDPRGPRPCPHSAIITPKPHLLARSGLKSDDFRSIVGYTTRDAVAAQGTSGANLFYLLDEGTGIPRPIMHALEGNCAGGGSIWMFFNPTDPSSFAGEAHLEPKKGFRNLEISSEESPNVKAGRVVIPGLATSEYIARMRRDYGEESALYQIHVRGKFVKGEDGKVITAHMLQVAKELWFETEAVGRLCVGLDPAGEGGQGDETTMTARRGYKQLEETLARTGLDEDAILAELVVYLAKHRSPREVPLVIVDSEGSIGAPLAKKLRNYSEEHPEIFEVVGVKASAPMPPTTTEIRYDRVRDALWGSLRDWFRNGGTIVEDPKMERELHEPKFIFVEDLAALKVTPKKELRKALGRSPDRADSLALACWERGFIRWAQDDEPKPKPVEETEYVEATFDPYEGLKPFGG